LCTCQRGVYIERVLALVRPTAPLALTLLAFGCSGGESRQVVPIREDFSECPAPLISDEIENTCMNEELRVLFKDADRLSTNYFPVRLPRSMGSVAIETDVVLHGVSDSAAKPRLVAGGTACVASDVDEPERGYEFLVMPEIHGFGIILLDEKDKALRSLRYTKPLYLRSSETVKGVGAVNRVRGECHSSNGAVQLTMFVNGEEVAHSTDSRFMSFEQVSIQATSTADGADIRFDNFLAEQIE